MRPLAVEQLIPLLRQGRVGVQEVDPRKEHVVRRVPLLTRVELVLGGPDVDLVQDLAGPDGVQHRLEERRLGPLVHLLVRRLGVNPQLRPLVQHGLGLVVVDHAVDARLEQLELAARRVRAVPGHDAGDLLGVVGAELAAGPGREPLARVVDGPPVRVVGEVEVVAQGHLERLEVADVDDPDAVGAARLGQLQLLGRLLELDGVDPLVVARVADVVEVVVDARAALALRLVGERQPAHVAPVVVGPQQRDALGDVEALLLVLLDFLVQAPGLRHGMDVNLEHLLDDGLLVVHQLLEHEEQGIEAQAALDLGVAGAAHGHGPQAVTRVGLGAAGADAEVLVDGLIVEVVGPRAVVVGAELVLSAHHGLGVRGAEHDLVGVGERLRLGVVGVDHVAPERGPEVVGAQAEDELEDETVELVGVAGGAVPGVGEVGAAVGVSGGRRNMEEGKRESTDPTQLLRPGCSSLMKKPRYRTDGEP